jgi:divalent metal cation (Fe/Co/Zn/Cd) transporter
VHGALTSHLAPDQVVVSLNLEFEDNLRVPQLEDVVLEIERRVRARHPEVTTLFIKPQTPRAFDDAVRARFRE